MLPLVEVLRTPGGSSFADASEAVLDFLRIHVPMGYWSVTRYDGARQVLLSLRDEHYGLERGQSFPWSETLCQHSTSGAAPEVAPDVRRVPLYATSGAVRDLPIAAYVGIPISRGDGTLFGTLCGLDPVTQDDLLAEHEPLLQLLTRLLAAVLDGDLARVEESRRAERAELLADTDALTGLCNRRGWHQFMDREEERYRRYGEPASVVMIDLDGLKEVNDQLGHTAGDELLQLAAATLRSTVRAVDLCARLGGDEFGVIATQTNVDEAAALIERIRQALDAAGVAASIGSSPFNYETGFYGAWQRADEAMYADKRSRRLSA